MLNLGLAGGIGRCDLGDGGQTGLLFHLHLVESAVVEEGKYRWAELMQRSFGFDVLACPCCPGRLKRVALVQDGAVIRRILHHLGLPSVVPEMRPSRAPPLPFASYDERVPEDDY